MEIRNASLNDLEQVAHLFNLYRQFYKQESDLIGAKEFLKQRLENHQSVILIALSEDDKTQVAGFVQLYPTFSSIGLRTAWVLNDLYVDPSIRGKGYGKELLSAAAEYSKASGARNMMLQTALTNRTAQQLYEKLGWKKDEEFLTYYLFH